METTIYQFVKNRKQQLTGVLYAQRMGDRVAVTWSKARLPLDRFDKERALDICKSRANIAIENDNPTMYVVNTPKSMCIEMEYFMERCRRYYKGIKVGG